jgi:pyoverdine/dityrosine biosynthesis protein Dit1
MKRMQLFLLSNVITMFLIVHNVQGAAIALAEPKPAALAAQPAVLSAVAAVAVHSAQAAIMNIPAACEAERSLEAYNKMLPRLCADPSRDLSLRIVEFLCQFCPDALRNQGRERPGQDVVQAKIKAFIDKNEPIRLVLLGFSSKSSNTKNKVIAPKVDFAEYVGLHTLNYMCQEISSAYHPGAQLELYTREVHMDALNDITQQALGVPLVAPEDMQRYAATIAALMRNFPHIKLSAIRNAEELYNALQKEMAGQRQQVEVAEVQGMKTFFKHELDCEAFAAAKKLSRSQVDKVCQSLALAYCQGTRVMRAVLQNNIHDYNSCVRLSVRPSPDGNVSSKLGIHLVYGSRGTPSHNLIAIDRNGVLSLQSKKDVAKKQYEQCAYAVDNLQLAYMQQKERTLPLDGVSSRSPSVRYKGSIFG